MRITNNMLSRQIVNNLNNIYDQMSRKHIKAATGKAFQKASENPYDAIRSMNIRDRLGRIEQYERNIANAKGTVLECETALTSINGSDGKSPMEVVKSILQQAANDTYNDSDKANMAIVVDNMKENIVSLLNKEFAGKYIFGGYNTAANPMEMKNGKLYYNDVEVSTMTATDYNLFKNETMVVKTGSGTNLDMSMPGITITGYGEDNLIGLFSQISDALKNGGTSDKFVELGEKLENRSDKIQNSISKLGGRTVRIETMTKQIEDSKYNLGELQSSIEVVDEEEAIMDYKMSEMVYNAALSMGAKLIQPTLVDFLR